MCFTLFLKRGCVSQDGRGLGQCAGRVDVAGGCRPSRQLPGWLQRRHTSGGRMVVTSDEGGKPGRRSTSRGRLIHPVRLSPRHLFRAELPALPHPPRASTRAGLGDPVGEAEVLVRDLRGVPYLLPDEDSTPTSRSAGLSADACDESALLSRTPAHVSSASAT